MRDSQSEGSLRSPEVLLLGVGAIFGAAAILSNPVAVGLPIAGTISVVTMMLSIDRLYEQATRAADATTESTPSRSA